jgi:hypothetical protein
MENRTKPTPSRTNLYTLGMVPPTTNRTNQCSLRVALGTVSLATLAFLVTIAVLLVDPNGLSPQHGAPLMSNGAPVDSTSTNSEAQSSTKEAQGAFLQSNGSPDLQLTRAETIPMDLLPLEFLQVDSYSEELYNSVKNGPYSKIGTFLGNLVESANRRFGALGMGMSQDADAVFVEIVGVSSLLLHDALIEMGVEVYTCYKYVCSARCPVNKLVEISNLEQVKLIQPSSVTTDSGPMTSQGDAAMKSDQVRETFSVDGEGVMVCVISDSYNCLGGAADDVENGELPDNLLVVVDLTEAQCAVTGSDEGRAMLQIVHDIAPGAQLAFHTGLLSAPAAILQMIGSGCDIIVDDLADYSQPFFQDGLLAQAANYAVLQGIPYFTSAGNLGRGSWEEPRGFQSSGTPFNYNGTMYGAAHVFDHDENGSPILFQNFSFPPAHTERINLFFQWDEPFFSASEDSVGSRSDLDIMLVFDGQIFTGGFDPNTGGDALEIVSFVPADHFSSITDEVAIGQMLILLKSGPAPGYMKIIDGSDRVEFGSNGRSSTITSHANSAYTAAVGAAHYRHTPEYGVSPPMVEPFSSTGGCPIFFDSKGTRLALPETREQPRVTGVDGISSFFGDLSVNGTAFYGTSAAAAHVGAVAALLLSFSPTLKPQEVYTALEAAAIDMDDPGTLGFDFGHDYATGYGLVDAEASIAFVARGGTTSKGGPKGGPKSGGKGSSKGASKGASSDEASSDEEYASKAPTPSKSKGGAKGKGVNTGQSNQPTRGLRRI